jgi:hypothetical protein
LKGVDFVLRPEIMNRIHETSSKGLENWLKANTIEISHPWYIGHPNLKAWVQEESDFIVEVLKFRKEA